MEDMDPVEPVQDMTSSHIHFLVKDNGPNATHREVTEIAGTDTFREESEAYAGVSAPKVSRLSLKNTISWDAMLKLLRHSLVQPGSSYHHRTGLKKAMRWRLCSRRRICG